MMNADEYEAFFKAHEPLPKHVLISPGVMVREMEEAVRVAIYQLRESSLLLKGLARERLDQYKLVVEAHKP